MDLNNFNPNAYLSPNALIFIRILKCIYGNSEGISRAICTPCGTNQSAMPGNQP